MENQPCFLMGRNPVREAVKNGRSIDKILVQEEQDGSLREITTLAKHRGIIVQPATRQKLDGMTLPFGHNGKPGNHQGIIALIPEVTYCAVADIIDAARTRNEDPFILVLDEINDPHNLGAMIRSAACAGAHGVIIAKRRAASVTAAVAKTSAGAIEYVKIARVVNINAAIQELKAKGVWVAGGDTEGTPMGEVDLTGPLAIVIGNEGEGLSRLVRENCDCVAKIPMKGAMASLNASVAAAILLFEKTRQDAAKG
ncbi:MAG: 23S rRNA (guanosine(2251)-2'-O)-methyltransferase RlmB [Clostridiales bacterium]|nr:23S rRNA (guanosine(2251)-2'-O)-methyltransferase RlmB [Clostridiales bacterium]